MNKSLETWLAWAPRVLAILFGLLLGVFAADVFSGSRQFLETSANLLLHLIPTFAVFGIVAVAWRREWFGALAFGGFAVAFAGFPWRTHAVIYGPLLMIDALYPLSWWHRRRKISAQGRSA